MNAPTVESKPAPKSHGSGTASGTYYKIEVRSWHLTRVLADPENPRNPYLIDKEWKEWPIRLSQGHGPAPSMPVAYFDRRPAEHGLMSYAAAMGHLYGLYAFLSANHWDLCVQARLVACRWEENWSITEENVSDVIAPERQPYKSFLTRVDADELAKTKEK